MSLNWNLGPNADEILRRYPSVKHEDGTESQNPVTYTIVVSTMAIGIGKLTKAKAAEFYARLSVLDRLHGPFVRDGEGKPRPITPEDILAHVGLETNVFPEETRAKWTKRILDDRLSSFVWRFNRAAEDAEKSVKADSVPAVEG